MPRTAVRVEAPPATASLRLPTWPLTLSVAAFPVWWVLGVGSVVWQIFAVPMALLLMQVRDVRVPRGFGVWLLFLVWMACSVIAVDTFGRVVGFAYRASLYAALTVFFVYAYNVVHRASQSSVLRLLTVFFAVVVAGGYLGLLLPTLVFRTPMAWVTPGFLMSNELVRDMVIIRSTQFNPDSWAALAPRPSAPFLFTNNWGSAYSLLLPVVATHWLARRHSRGFVALGLLVAASAVPAVLTLNRGMFLGLGVAAMVLGVRHALRGNVRVLLTMGVLGLVGAGVLLTLPVLDRLSHRVEASGTNYSRLTVYTETIEAVARSPWFGYGAPRPTPSTVVPLGTQGQVWMVLFSHGFVGLALFLGFLALLVVSTLRRTDLVGMSLNASLVVLLVQSFYYGLLFQGLLVGFLVAAAALHPPDESPRPPTTPASL